MGCGGNASKPYPVHGRDWKPGFPQIPEPRAMAESLAGRGDGAGMVPEEDLKPRMGTPGEGDAQH